MIWQENRLVSKYIMRRDDPRNGFIEYADSVPSRLKDVLRSSRRLEPNKILVFLVVSPRALCLLSESELQRLHTVFPEGNVQLHACIDALHLFECEFMRPEAVVPKDGSSPEQVREWEQLIKKSVNFDIARAVILERLHFSLVEALGADCDQKRANAAPSDARFSLVAGAANAGEFNLKELIIYDRENKEVTFFSANLAGGELPYAGINASQCRLVVREKEHGRGKEQELFLRSAADQESSVFLKFNYCDFRRPNRLFHTTFFSPLDENDRVVTPCNLAKTLISFGYQEVESASLPKGWSCYYRPTNDPEFWSQLTALDDLIGLDRLYLKEQEEARLGRELETDKTVLTSLLVVDQEGKVVSGWFDKEGPKIGCTYPHNYRDTHPSEYRPLSHPIEQLDCVLYRFQGWCIGVSATDYVATTLTPIQAPKVTDEDLIDPEISIGKEVKLNIGYSAADACAAIMAIKNFNGRPISEIERNMRPGAFSTPGFLKQGDSLLNAIYNAFLELQRLSVTPRLLRAVCDVPNQADPLAKFLGAWYGCHHVFFICYCDGWGRNYGLINNPFALKSERFLDTLERTFLKYKIKEKSLDYHKKSGQLVISFTGVQLALLQYCFLQTGPYEFKIGELMYAITQAMNSPFTETAASATPPSQSHKIPAAGQSDVTSAAAENTAAAAIPIAMAGNSQSLYRMPSGGDVSAGENPQNICGKK